MTSNTAQSADIYHGGHVVGLLNVEVVRVTKRAPLFRVGGLFIGRNGKYAGCR